MISIKVLMAYLMLMIINVRSYNLVNELGKARYKKSFILNVNKKINKECPLLEYFNNRQKRVDDIVMENKEDVKDSYDIEKDIKIWLEQMGEVNMLD